MDADPPLVQEVPSQPDVSPNLDHSITSPKQMEKLRKDMAAFFDEADAKEAAAKEALKAAEAPKSVTPEKKDQTPQAPAIAQPEKSKAKAEPTELKETIEPKAEEPKPELEFKPEPKAGAHPHPITDKELDDIQIHEDATEPQKGRFKQLKDIATDYREQLKRAKEQLKLYQDVVGPLAKEFGHEIGEDPNTLVTSLSEAAADIRKTKETSLTPDIQGELEYLRALQRSVDVLNSREFVSKHVEPWLKSYHNLIDDICLYCNGTAEQIEDYRKQLKETIKPRDIDPKYWEKEIERVAEAGKASKYDILRLHDEVKDMLKLQREHDDTAKELLTNQGGYERWMADRKRENDQVWVQGVERAVGEAVRSANGPKKHMASLFPLPDSKDPEEQKKVVAHNSRFQEMAGRFRKFIEDFQKGPQGAAETALDYIDQQNTILRLQSDIGSRTAEIEGLKKKDTDSAEQIAALNAKIKQLESEVSSRRRISDTPLKPTAGAVKQTPGKPALPKGSRGGLDEAFKNFQWPTT